MEFLRPMFMSGLVCGTILSAIFIPYNASHIGMRQAINIQWPMFVWIAICVTGLLLT